MPVWPARGGSRAAAGDDGVISSPSPAKRPSFEYAPLPLQKNSRRRPQLVPVRAFYPHLRTVVGEIAVDDAILQHTPNASATPPASRRTGRRHVVGRRPASPRKRDADRPRAMPKPRRSGHATTPARPWRAHQDDREGRAMGRGPEGDNPDEAMRSKRRSVPSAKTRRYSARRRGRRKCRSAECW